MKEITKEEIIKKAQEILKPGIILIDVKRSWFTGMMSGGFWTLILEKGGEKIEIDVSEKDLGFEQAEDFL